MSPLPGTGTRVLLLGFDAANPDLLRRWAADGSLPNLRGLMDRGLVGRTRSVEGFLVASTWPSFYTGVTPARHGFHYIAQVRPGTYQYEMASVRHPPLWSRLSRAGKRSAVLDIPLCEPDPAINGIHVVDWGGIEEWASLKTVPASLGKQILSEWGEHPLQYRGDDLRRTAQEYLALEDVLTRGARTRAELSRRFLAQERWDLFAQVFSESHCAGHNLWHIHDPRHPSHDAALSAGLGDPLRRIYAEVDAAMGRVIEVAGDATVLVISAHGMSHWVGAQFVLTEILHRLGAAVRRPPVPPEQGLVAAAERGLRAAWRLVPRTIRDRVFTLRSAMHRKSQGAPPLPAIESDTARSRCFVVRNGHLTAGIRLNLAGREPTGVLTPGPETEAFVAQLTTDLLEIIDQRTGRPLITRIRRTRELYAGPFLDELPDLLLDWDDQVATGNSNIAAGAAATVVAHSEKIGMVEGTNHFSRTGDHRIEGLFVAAGPGIRPGRMVREVSVMDFAPTISKMLGVDLPDVDGQIIPELLPQQPPDP